MKKEFAKLCKIIIIIFKKRKQKNLKLNKKLNSLKEFDSLNHLNLIFLIEKEFAVKFSLKDIEKIKTIGDILKFLKK